MTCNEKNTKIKYGELQVYYPLKFDAKLSFTKICEKIEKSSISYSEEYRNKKMGEMSLFAKEITNELNDALPEETSIRWRIREDVEVYDDISTKNLSGSDIQVEIYENDELPKMKMTNRELEILDARVERIIGEYEISSVYYDQRFVDNHERFLLLPLKVILPNDETVYMHTILYVFSNGMALLKFELPLKDVETTALKQNAVQTYFSNLECTWTETHFEKTNWKSISKFYCECIFNETKINMWTYNFSFQNIIMVDFTGMPQNVNDLSEDLQEELFRIICAPVPERENTSFKEDATRYIKNHAWGNHNLKYIMCTNGGCLSIIDQSMIDYSVKKYKKKMERTTLDENDYYIIYNGLARDMQMNAEMAFIITMLKKMNQSNDYIQKKSSAKELGKIKREFWENTIYITELQDGSYASVLEQITAFENMMPYFIKQESAEIKMTALDNILQENQKQQTEGFQNFVTIVGLFMSLIFGLSSIRDTLIIVRGVLYFISCDIPILTIENVSVVFWVLLNGFIIIKLLVRRKKQKGFAIRRHYTNK